MFGQPCRSQMAEGWPCHLAGSQFEVLSTGTNPVGANPRAVEAMGEVRIDLSRHCSKHVAELQGRHLHSVMTVCDHAQASCRAVQRRLTLDFCDSYRGLNELFRSLLEEMSSCIGVLMILPRHKIPSLNARRCSVECVMRLLNKSKLAASNRSIVVTLKLVQVQQGDQRVCTPGF